MKPIFIIFFCAACIASSVHAQKPYTVIPATYSAVGRAAQQAVAKTLNFGQVGAVVFSAARTIDTMASCSDPSSHVRIPVVHDIPVVSAVSALPETPALSDLLASRELFAAFDTWANSALAINTVGCWQMKRDSELPNTPYQR